jgi:zinc D-Ala-D-Ala dipeptidase
MRRQFQVIAIIMVAGCKQPAPVPTAPPAGTSQATQANTPDQPIAPDSVARERLADLRTAVPGARFELRYATTNNFTGSVLPGYGAAVPLLRREASLALAKVEKELEVRGYGLKIFDGYRPRRGTLGMVAWCEANHRVDLLDNGYIARRSRHNQGVAIDLTVVDFKTGQELEMGTPFDNFTDKAHTANAAGVQAANRKILGDAMTRAGFINYVDEWWHFSFEVPDPVPFDLPLERW